MEVLDWARAVFALLLTLALIGGVAYGARRLGMLQPLAKTARRLAITETLMIDPRRRLVLVRLDGREHLILLGPGGDVVVSDVEAKAVIEPQPEPQT